MPVVNRPRPLQKQSEAVEKGAAARQYQMFYDMSFKSSSKLPRYSDLVAEPRFKCGIAFLVTLLPIAFLMCGSNVPSLVLTSITTTLAISTANVGSAVVDNSPTITTTMLAISTTTEHLGETAWKDGTTEFANGVTMPTDMSDGSTLTSTILATSTTNRDDKAAEVVSRVFDRSHKHARQIMDRIDRLHQSVDEDLQPAELLKRLQHLGLLDDDDLQELDAMSLYEQRSRLLSDEPKDVSTVVRGRDPRHDVWWYANDDDFDDSQTAEHMFSDGGVTQASGMPEVVTSPTTTFHGTLSSALKQPGGGNSDSTVFHESNHTNGTGTGRFLKKIIGRLLQSHDLTLTDVSQLSSMTVPGRKAPGQLKTNHWSVRHRLHIIMVVVGSVTVLSTVGMMQHARFGQRMPQNSPYQQDVGAATLKTPPAWCYENAAQYTLRSWLSDVLMWSSATDVEVERQGPAVALQITGVARDLIREINPQHLREGLHEQGVHIPGLMLLCRTLANHFAPLESELQTRAMAELMNFARMGHETIDVSLTRFEVLRHRAAQRGGLMMNTTTMSYLLLNGLRLRPEQWERALMPLDGQLPHDDHSFQQLFERLRRIGRMQEGHFNPPNREGATGDLGYHFFPTFDQPNSMPGTGCGMDYATYYGGNRHNPGSNLNNDQNPHMPDMPSSSGLDNSQAYASIPITEEEDQCTRCGMYYEDEFSSGTESDDGEADSEASHSTVTHPC